MKTRNGFISNSSSTSFIITNTSKEKKTLVEFVAENPQLIEEFLSKYPWYRDSMNRFNQLMLLYDAKKRKITFEPGESKECVFGDEQDDTIGQVFDYILRLRGKSKSFKWKLNEYLR